MELQERKKWIDIAKGVAIILVIIGHSAPYKSVTRNLIYSFHMPLFFILSGYCTKTFSSVELAKQYTIRRFKKLFKVVSLIECLTLLYNLWQQQSSLYRIICQTAEKLFWASGSQIIAPHLAIGMPWFLISLIIGGGIIDNINCRVDDNFSKLIIFTFLPFIGFLFGASKRWLPFNLDVTFVCVGFIYIGMILHKHSKYLMDYKVPIFLIANILWLYWVNQGLYIELASRHYPGWSISYVEAILSTVVFCYLAQTFENNKTFCNIFSTLGKHTMIIFTIHALDFMWLPLIASKSWMMLSVKRVCVDLTVAGIFLICHRFVKKVHLHSNNH